MTEKLNFPNIGWKFYKEYYWKDVTANRVRTSLNRHALNQKENSGNKKILEDNEESFKQRNKDIIETKVATVNSLKLDSTLFARGKHSFELKTTYPGLLVGTGYNHETGSKGEIKLGFYFDHTTGLPLINGSSVKGVIREAFKQEVFIAYLLKELGVPLDETNQHEDLINEIFCGQRKGKAEEKAEASLEPFSIYERDTFYDAFIIAANENGQIMGDDAITPHYKSKDRKATDLLKNPIPLLFIKVLPKVKFLFSFDLHDSKVLKGLTADKKASLFQRILQHMGVGAKTNVGYGKMT